MPHLSDLSDHNSRQYILPLDCEDAYLGFQLQLLQRRGRFVQLPNKQRARITTHYHRK